MQKVSIYKGIEFVRLSQLPAEERQQIRNWLGEEMLIKIQTDKELLVDCLEYKYYTRWFETIFTSASPAPQSELNNNPNKPKTKSISHLAFE